MRLMDRHLRNRTKKTIPKRTVISFWGKALTQINKPTHMDSEIETNKRWRFELKARFNRRAKVVPN